MNINMHEGIQGHWYLDMFSNLKVNENSHLSSVDVKQLKIDQYMISHNRSDYSQLITNKATENDPRTLYYFTTHHENYSFAMSGQMMKLLLEKLNNQYKENYNTNYESDSIKNNSDNKKLIVTPDTKGILK